VAHDEEGAQDRDGIASGAASYGVQGDEDGDEEVEVDDADHGFGLAVGVEGRPAVVAEFAASG